MIERKQERRQRISWSSWLTHERRQGFERRAWAAVAAVVGMIRPGVGEVAPRERRRFPESGSE
jgi:hypothetical protein